MEVEKEVKKMTLGHEFGAGAACLKCKDKCEGFELHFWRKTCRNCRCGLAEHDVPLRRQEAQKVGRLLQDTKYTGLVARLQTDAGPRQQPPAPAAALPGPSSAPAPAASAGAAQTVADAVSGGVGPAAPAAGVAASSPPPAGPVGVSGAAASLVPVPVKTATYEWAPAVPNRHLAVLYMELLPPEKRPVAGTAGAAYRRQQMALQLPEHDQDPSRCHQLSAAEVGQLQQYVRRYKDEALGVGDVLLPEDVARARAAAGDAAPPGAGGGAVTAGGRAGGAVATAAAAGTVGAGPPQDNFSCHQCLQPMRRGEPAVYAERAGFDKLWHPACFVCCTCGELLVDMIYFWKRGRMYCGRHYGDSEKPRCAGCDELIFSNEYTQAEGHDWHLKHFCCFDCDRVLAGETYVMEKDTPICKPCYMSSYAAKCASCQDLVDPEAQRVSYGEHHWHADPQCFRCSGCSRCLMGQRFMAVQNFLFCSVECKKKVKP